MDLTSLLSTVLSAESVGNMSQAANVSEQDVQNVLNTALPMLLNGALSQSESSETAEGFAGALNQHSQDDTANLSAFLSGVDRDDGAKIVAHLLGAGSGAAVNQVSQKAGVSQDSARNIMSAAAPLLMSLLGQQANAQKKKNSALGIAGIMGALMKNADMGAVLTSLMGNGK